MQFFIVSARTSCSLVHINRDGTVLYCANTVEHSERSERGTRLVLVSDTNTYSDVIEISVRLLSLSSRDYRT